MQGILNHFRYAIRHWSNSPGFTLIAVLTLGVGLGANTTIFSIVSGFLLKPFPFDDPGRLVMVGTESSRREWRLGNLSFPDYLDIRAQNTVFENVAVYDWEPYNLAGGDEPVWASGARVSGNFFDGMRVKPLLGRLFLQEDDRPGAAKVVLLSEGLWKSQFAADPGIVGKAIQLDSESRTVVGVIPSGLEVPENARVWIPLALDPSTQNRGSTWLSCVARLKADATEDQARADLAMIAHRLQADFSDSNQETLFTAMSLREERIGELKPAFFFLLGSVGFLLLIVCANVMNLLLSKAAVRSKEFAIRAAMGASRKQLIKQLLVESFLLAILSCGVGLVICVFGIDTIRSLIPVELPSWVSFEPDYRVFIFTGLLAVGTTFLFGTVPAWSASKANLQDQLRDASGRSSASAGAQRLQRVLVISELAVALTLLAGAGIMMRGFLFLSQSDPGFEADNALTATAALPPELYRAPEKRIQLYRQSLERIRSHPQTTGAAVVSHFPLSGSASSSSYSIEGQDVQEFEANPMALRKSASPDYFRAMDIQLLRGRAFRDSDTAASLPVAIVNKPLADHFWKNEDPVGRRFKFDSPDGDSAWVEIVGVVEGARHIRIHESPMPQIYQPYEQNPSQRLCFVVRTLGDPEAMAKPLGEAIRSIDSNQALFRVMSLSGLIEQQLWPFRMFTWLFWVFGACALSLASIGIYGVIAHGVSQRTREFGIRIAMGAQSRDVLILVLRQGMKLLLIGGGIGLVASIFLTKFMATVLMQVSFTDLVALSGSVALLGGAALSACFIPARRATKVDPMVALRHE